MRNSDPKPQSAVSGATGVAGLVGLAAWFAVARAFHMDGPYAAMTAVIACGLPMAVWSIAVDRVHRNPSTGIDWSAPRRWRETIDISLTKLGGLWATWGAIAIFYCIGRWYWQGSYLFAMELLAGAAPFLVLLSIPYVIWIDRRLIEPRDGAYAFGHYLAGGAHDRDALIEHVRSWTVKAFFTAFMLSIVPGNWADLIGWSTEAILSDPVALTRFLIAAMFLIDVAFATVGYVLTCRPLDAHIRSANPYAAGWTAALICYPPFVMMGPDGPLDYHQGTADWNWWLEAHPALLALTGMLLVGLTGIYAWATVAFGPRFSNLTHRGILTHGPYRWTRHPAYLSKNLFWWLSTLPFLSVNGSLTEIVRNSAILGIIGSVYYWRAKTEERHLSSDPAYRAYSEWIERNGPLARLKRRIARPAVPVAAE